MSEDKDRAPLLDAFYHSYLTDETSAHFVANVSNQMGQNLPARIGIFHLNSLIPIVQGDDL